MKVLQEGKDFEVIEKKVMTEFFVWTCPDCGKKHQDIEWSVYPDFKLVCNQCSQQFKYQFQSNS